jgi:hypothetical protein
MGSHHALVAANLKAAGINNPPLLRPISPPSPRPEHSMISYFYLSNLFLSLCTAQLSVKHIHTDTDADTDTDTNTDKDRHTHTVYAFSHHEQYLNIHPIRSSFRAGDSSSLAGYDGTCNSMPGWNPGAAWNPQSGGGCTLNPMYNQPG